MSVELVEDLSSSKRAAAPYNFSRKSYGLPCEKVIPTDNGQGPEPDSKHYTRHTRSTDKDVAMPDSSKCAEENYWHCLDTLNGLSQKYDCLNHE